ncbi:MAG TPA: KH domain-containing protein [Edaphobacter sp.]|nr:KH domain-containing protein [Edaphobacter sp.]
MAQATATTAGDDSAKNMSDLVLEIARALVDSPESVSVEVVNEAEGTILRLRVAQSDVGKVIGKQGRTARSLRTILSAASMKLRHRFALDIVEEGERPTHEH